MLNSSPFRPGERVIIFTDLTQSGRRFQAEGIFMTYDRISDSGIVKTANGQTFIVPTKNIHLRYDLNPVPLGDTDICDFAVEKPAWKPLTSSDLALFADFTADIHRKKEHNEMKLPEIKNVYFNCPVTVVMWKDGTKTIVRCSENDAYDPEKGLAMAIIKKMSGNDNSFHKIFKKWIPEAAECQMNMHDLFKSMNEHADKALTED